MVKWNFRDWPRLDLDKSAPFMPWFNRFRRWAKDGRESMERLLKLLESEVAPIDPSREEFFKDAAGLPAHWRGSQVSKELADAIVSTGTDSVAARAREFGDSCGFELYRWVFEVQGRWAGAGACVVPGSGPPRAVPGHRR